MGKTQDKKKDRNKLQALFKKHVVEMIDGDETAKSIVLNELNYFLKNEAKNLSFFGDIDILSTSPILIQTIKKDPASSNTDKAKCLKEILDHLTQDNTYVHSRFLKELKELLKEFLKKSKKDEAAKQSTMPESKNPSLNSG